MSLNALKDAWWRTFPPAEVRLALAAIDHIFSNHRGGYAHRRALEVIGLARLSMPIIRDQGVEVVVVRTALGTLLRDISSGEHHFYRGVLSMHGEQLRALFNQILATAAIKNIVPAEDVQIWHEDLQEGIKNAG